ncbi:MAG: heme-binding domain-containing protein [Bdellovibrionota bacterium]
MKRQIIISIIFLLPILAMAHGEHHENLENAHKDSIANGENNYHRDELLRKINKSYTNSIKQIFQEKCYNCHSNQTKYPWYYPIPGIRQLIDHDIKDALEHLDFTNDFPFAGHGTPKEDLEELIEVVDEDSMPPWQYLIMHRDHKLSSDEKNDIILWAESSLNLLSAQK